MFRLAGWGSKIEERERQAMLTTIKLNDKTINPTVCKLSSLEVGAVFKIQDSTYYWQKVGLPTKYVLLPEYVLQPDTVDFYVIPVRATITIDIQ